MDNETLCQLIRAALHSPEQAEVLALAIDHLPEVTRYLGEGWLPYYNQALPTTERDIKQNINKFPKVYSLNLEITNCQNSNEATNLRQRFISWIMIILKRDCYDVKRGQKNRPRPVDMSATLGGDGGLTVEETIADDLTRSGIRLLLEQELLSLGTQMKRYIEEDTEMKLRNCHPRNCLNANCQVLSQKLLLKKPPLNPREVAVELNIPEQTVYDRWRNYCRPLLQKIAKELGYEN